MPRYFNENLPRTHEQFGIQAGYERIEKPDEMHNNILKVLEKRVSSEWKFDHVRMEVNTEKKRHGSSDLDLVYVFERVKPAKKLRLNRREEDEQYTKYMRAILDPFSPEAKKAEKERKAFFKEIERGIPRKYFCMFVHHLYGFYPTNDKILYYYLTLGDRKEAIDSLALKRNEIDEQMEELTKPFSR